MNICKLSLVIILQRYSQSLPYSTFLMCWVHWYEFTLRFANTRGRVSLINNLLQTLYCTLFFIWVFPWGFSYKVFNEAISTQGYVISLIYPHRGFWWMILAHKMHCTLFFMWVFPFEVSHIKFLMRQCQHKGICYIIYFSPPGFFGRWYLKHIDPMVKVFLD